MQRTVVLGFLMSFCSPLLAEVDVQDAWVRLLPPVVKTTAAYFSITSSEPDRLLAVKSMVAERVEMHDSKMTDGVMSMMQLNEVELPKGETVHFKPHGLHVMLIQLSRPLSRGDTVILELQLEKAGQVYVPAKVHLGDE